jgi:hypothetical protein
MMHLNATQARRGWWYFAGTVLLVMAMEAVAHSAPLNSHYETDLDNYRVCAPDEDGNVLGTCSFDDVRSPSKYYLNHDTQGSISYNGTVVKLRINDIRIDEGTSFACENETVPCVDNICPITGAFCGGPTCTAPACQGGPKDGKNCNPSSPDTVCKNLDNVAHFGDVVFQTNYAGFELVSGFPFKLYGDASSPGTGCTKICAFGTLNDSSPSTGKVDSNSLTCELVGDCSQEQGFHRVTVVDVEGNTLAIPSVGKAFILTIGYEGDPAALGDACRGASPPDNCP